MGKLLRQKNSRIRMTNYNIAKALKIVEIKDNSTEMLEQELSQIKTENCILIKQKSTFSTEFSTALKEQKVELNEKHKAILSMHSEKLKIKYKANFDEAIAFYRSEISELNEKLKMANKRVLSSNIRIPLFSSGRYSSRETSPMKSTMNTTCSCKFICICLKERDNG